MSAVDVFLTCVYVIEILGFAAVVAWMLFYLHAIICGTENE